MFGGDEFFNDALEPVQDSWVWDGVAWTELAVFDPEAAAGRATGAERVALQLFRREADSGFVRVFRGTGPARSETS